MKRLLLIMLILLGITAIVVPQTALALEINYDFSGVARVGNQVNFFSPYEGSKATVTLGGYGDSLAVGESGEIPLVENPEWEDKLPELLTDNLLTHVTYPGESEDVNTVLPKPHCVDGELDTPPIGAVPEPNTIALLGLGLAVISFVHFRKM